MVDREHMKDLEAFLKKAPDTELLEIAAADMNGILRGKRLQSEDFAKPFKASGIKKTFGILDPSNLGPV